MPKNSNTVSRAIRTVSSAGNNSYRLLDDSISPYGLNTDQDVGIVEKEVSQEGRPSRISSTTYSYESRPRFMQKEAKNLELIYSALYTFYFKEKRYAEDDDYILVVSINDVNIDRPQVTSLHKDGFVPHTFLKKLISEMGVVAGIEQMTENIMHILRSMGGETPEIVSIKFKTAAPGEDPRIIITTIREGQNYTYSTAPAAAGNEMPQVFFKNREVLHGTPAPIDLEFLKETYMTETGKILPPNAVEYINKFNSYMEEAKKHTRHFVRRAANTLFHKNTIPDPDPETSLKIASVKIDIASVKTRMMSESAITNIDGKITIKNTYVLDDLEDNLDKNFRNWEEYGNLNVNGEVYNLLERLQSNDDAIKVNVNEEIPWPLEFHLIRFKNIGGLYMPDGPDVSTPEELDNKKRKVKNFINPKDLSVYQEYIVDYNDNIKNKIIAMVNSQNSPKIMRFSLDKSGCLADTVLGGSRSRSNRKKQRNTKKKQNKLRKGRRTKQKKHNKRRSRKIR
jgi:hypothetical protein